MRPNSNTYPFFIFSDEVISYDDENKDVLYKIELFDELQNEVAETRTDNERLQQVIYIFYSFLFQSWTDNFSNFSCIFLNPIFFQFVFWFIISEKQVKKTFCYQKIVLTFHCLNKLFWQTLGLQPRISKFFSVTRTNFFSQ